MSSPTMDMPEHFPMSVDSQGRGPAEGSDFDHWICWCGTPECRKWLDEFDPYAEPSEDIPDVQYAFPANLGPLVPPWTMIPDEFKTGRGEWVRFAGRWFGTGFPESGVIRREGIDAETAHRHLWTIMRSYSYKHEHKIAAVAWLASRWWEGIVTEDQNPEKRQA